MFHVAHGIGFFRWSGLLCPPWIPIRCGGWGSPSLGYLLHCLTLDFSGSSDGKESACNVGDLGWISESGRSPGEGNGNPLQNSCLKNPMDRGARRATDHGVTMSRTRLSDFHILSFITLDAKDWFMRISEQVGWSIWNGMLWAEYFELLMIWYMMFLVGRIKASCLMINRGMAFASVFIGCVVF